MTTNNRFEEFILSIASTKSQEVYKLEVPKNMYILKCYPLSTVDKLTKI